MKSMDNPLGGRRHVIEHILCTLSWESMSHVDDITDAIQHHVLNTIHTTNMVRTPHCKLQLPHH